MDIGVFLSSTQASLPKSRKDGDYAAFYKSFTDDFFKLAATIDNNGPIAKEVINNLSISIELRDSIAATLKQYYDGHTNKAYETLKTAVINFLPVLKNIISSNVDKDYLKNLYRIRLIDDKLFSKAEMFHIPFNLRHLVATQRYSIPGFPSLYLSSSLYTTWKELVCPDFNKIMAVRVEPTDDVKLLDFGYPTQYLAPTIGSYNKVAPSSKALFGLLTAPIIAWPLIAACSVSVLNKKAPFKPEYIIPQILLQLVRNDELGNDIQGIRYFSINYGQSNHSINLGTNFVFPVKESQDSGFCPELEKFFKLTEPISWQLATTVYEEQDLSQTPDVFLEILKGAPVHYKTTTFARVEAMLIHQPASFL